MPRASFSKRHCERVLRKAGAVQVSSGAIEELRMAIEKYALDISKRAILFAHDSARYRVIRKDVKDGVKEFLSSDHF